MFLLVASYFFYGWWSWKFMGLLALSTFLDYLYAFGVASASQRKSRFFLWLSIINNLGILMVFKYFNFFEEQFEYVLHQIGVQFNPVLLRVALPVGISFYTFHGMSYVFDVYRKLQKPVTDFTEYAVFVSFFPLLVSGPIERAGHLLPQVQKPRKFNVNQSLEGFDLMVWGMLKKVVVADNLAPAVNDIFSNAHGLHSATLILGAVYFSFQIYCDFSGYTDIARGVAKLLGFELLLNFNNPYLSKSIPEFWKRWHISLSSWFRDYLYIPLGGSRVSVVKSIRNVLIVFLVSGFWHGANWTFIVWGLIHAVCFLPGFILRKTKSEKVTLERKHSKVVLSFQIAGTFIIVTTAWIFFRAESVSQALQYIQRIATSGLLFSEFQNWRSISTEGSHLEFLSILIVFLISFRVSRISNRVLKNAVLVLIILILGSFVNPSNFIYFQF